MPSHRIVITGAHGMLGTDLTLEARKIFGESSVIAMGHGDLDITLGGQVDLLLGELKPTLVINAAAYTNVDGAEIERDAARALNCLGPMNLAATCTRIGAKCIHFSTDQVFNGESLRPWVESDPVGPVNYYAQSKLDGERAVLAHPFHSVFRVQWLYGLKKERFSQIRQKPVFTPFADQWGAPTWTRDVARSIMKATHLSGLFHFAYDDFASWADVFAFVKTEWNLEVLLEPRKTSSVALPARRPLYCVLSNQKLKDNLKIDRVGSWRDALSEFLKIVH